MKTYRVGKTICKSCIWWIINSIIRKPTAQLKIRQRLEQTHHQRGLNTENKCIKYLLYYYPIRKFKTIMGYHYIPIKWLKLKKKKSWVSSVAMTQSNYSSHTLLVRMQNHTSALENRLAVSNDVKHTPTIWVSNTLFGYFPWRRENWYSHKKPVCKYWE